MSAARREYRKHSKATLVRAAALLYEDKVNRARLARRLWLWRLAWASGAAFLAGLVLGWLVGR